MASRRADPTLSEFAKLRALETRTATTKTYAGNLRVNLVYPNNYWIAMSNLGFQAVWSLFAQNSEVQVERGFLPENLDSRGPWRTFENSRPLADCDILGFSLSFETDYPNMVKILANQSLLFESQVERDLSATNQRVPLIIAGGTGVTLNPEPIANFVDAIVIGEAEELISDLVECVRLAKERGEDRLTVLRNLAKIEGIYVPRFYDVSYNSDGTVSGFTADPLVAARPRRRIVQDISKYPTYTKILTPQTEFSSMFLTETGRGCEVGCRFCVAGYIYRPVRKRSTESIQKTVEIGLENSAKIGFVGAAVSSHKGIARLASGVAQTGARASLSSLMSQKVSRELAASLSESEYKTVALAPEAGTERLRFAVGKRVKNSQVIEAAQTLTEAGIRGFKLYFIIGLPTETDQDIAGIIELATQIRDVVVQSSKGSGRVGWVALSVNPFIPKASTPFQWEPMAGLKELEAKIETIREAVKRIPNLELRFESPKESFFQALLSRGDRRVSQLLLELERKGKDWKYLLRKTSQPIVAGVPPLDFYTLRHIPYAEILPWDVVDSRIEKKLLEREARRAHVLVPVLDSGRLSDSEQGTVQLKIDFSEQVAPCGA